MRKSRFWTTTLVSPLAVLLAGISQIVLVSPAFSQVAPPYPNDPGSGYIRPEFENPSSSSQTPESRPTPLPVEPSANSRSSSFPGKSLTGKWSFEQPDASYTFITPVTQTGNQVKMLQEFDGGIHDQDGTISGNQIRFDNWYASEGLEGTISPDGNTIEGKIIRSGPWMPTTRFRMRRVGS